MYDDHEWGIICQTRRMTAAYGLWSLPGMEFHFQKSRLSLQLLHGKQASTIFTLDRRYMVISSVVVMESPPTYPLTPVNNIHMTVPVERMQGYHFSQDDTALTLIIKPNSMIRPVGKVALYEDEPFKPSKLSEECRCQGPPVLNHRIYLNGWAESEIDQYLDHLNSFLQKIGTDER